MVWWIFTKKSSEKWQELHNSLNNSFSNIKKDITEINNWLKEHSDILNDHHQKHDDISKKISQLEDIMLKIKVLQPEIKKDELKIEEKTTENKIEPIWDELTNVQKSLFLRLAVLLKESNTKWISTKILAQEIYPEKRHNSLKSMMSVYTSVLLNYGLIEKRRRGKENHFTITDKGYTFLPNNLQKEVKIVQKTMKRRSGNIKRSA